MGRRRDDAAARRKLDEIPFQPWARAVYDIRQIDQFEPHTRCKARACRGSSRRPTAPSSSRSPTCSACTSWTTAVRTRTGSSISTDVRSRRTSPPTNYGYSIGRWEGDTLVVETRGLNEKFWLDTRGTPHTAQLKFTERFTRTDMNTLRYQATIDDPGAYTKPWTTTEFNLRWRPGDELFEYICQQFNQGPELMLGSQEDDRQHALLRSLVAREVRVRCE